MIDVKIAEQINYYNGYTWFELFDIESGEVLHEDDSYQGCLNHYNSLDKNKYELLED